MEQKSPQRRPSRLKTFDYSQNGAYFITLCTHNRQPLFKIDVGNDLCVVPPLQNKIIHKWIKETQNKFPHMRIDKYVIMPDHLHFIISITERHTGRSLPDMMHFFKTMTTNEYIRAVKEGNLPPFHRKLWQKSYYDHVIRNQHDYNEIWDYIENNPQKWLLSKNEQV